MKILLIDDDAMVRRTIGRVLRRAGYDVAMAENGCQGIELLQAENPDLMITDIIMPDQEGIETILEARRLRPDIKIIAISGGGRLLGDMDHLSAALALGATAAITKPFRPSELVDAVARYLSPAM